MKSNDLKILGILPHSIAGRFIANDIFNGFKKLGHKVIIIDLLKEFSIPKENFDYVVGYGFSAIKFNKENDLNLKTINYFADVIETSAAGSGFDKYKDELFNPQNYSFYWDKKLTEKADYKNLFYMPLFVNTDIYKDLDLNKEYDVMFAGRLNTANRLNIICDLLESMPEVNFAWFAIEKHYEDALLHATKPELIKKIYKGFIENQNDMNKALNKAKIVININTQGESSINYRTFETLACKTLLITDEREELSLLNNLVPTFNNLKDLKEKIKYYLSHDNSETLEKCHDIIIKNFDSKICVEKMLTQIELTQVNF